MIVVQILSLKPQINEGISKASGKPYRIVKQAAVFNYGGGEGFAFSIQPPRDEAPYPAGNYTIGADSFYERDGEIRFTPRLVAAAGGPK